MVSGNGVDSTITIMSSGIVIQDLVVTGSGNPHAGIDIRGSGGVIEGCRIINNNGYGISVTSSEGSIIAQNTIEGNGLGGVLLQSCQNCQIYRNSLAATEATASMSPLTGNVIFLNNFNNALNARDSGFRKQMELRSRLSPMSTTRGHFPFPWATTGQTIPARMAMATAWETAPIT